MAQKEIIERIKSLLRRKKKLSNTQIGKIIEDEFGKDQISFETARKWVSKIKKCKVNVPQDHYIEKISLKDLISKKRSQMKQNVDQSFKENGEAEITYNGSQVITSIDQAIDHFGIDTEKYVVWGRFGQSAVTMKLMKHEIKSLNEKDRVLYSQKPIQIINYNCKIFLSPKKKSLDDKISKLMSWVKKNGNKSRPKRRVSKKGASDKYIWGMADFHLGLDNENFSASVLIHRLRQCADLINDCGGKENHLVLAGDFWESVAVPFMHTGQSVEIDRKYVGTRGARAAWKIFDEFLFSKVDALTSIQIVAGNHDRTSHNSKDATPYNSMAEIFYWFCKDNCAKGVDVRYDYSVLEFTVDDISYIVTHGDKRMVNNSAQFISDYGNKLADYTCVLTGHYHHRKTKKTIIKHAMVYENVVTVVEKSANHRVIQLPALAGEGQFSKELGVSSTPGIIGIKRPKKEINNVMVIDVPIE